MHVVITGANGFVGRALTERLLLERRIGQRALRALTLMDLDLPADLEAQGLRLCPGSIADPATAAAAFDRDVDVVFHLASIPGGLAEQHYELARDVNLHGTEHLLERGRAQVLRAAPPPVFVFASTIAVFGSPLPERVDEDTLFNPQMTYGAQKLAGEFLVADFSRRGWVDGRSLRLPGVLARPPAPTGQLSAFMSDMIRELLAGRPFTCPTSPGATTWASSIGNVVDNMLHGAALHADALRGRRSLTLPTLRFSFAELAQAIGEVRGADVSGLVQWAPDARIEALFGSFPALSTAHAEAIGFCSDGNLGVLVRRAHDARLPEQGIESASPGF